MQTTNTAPAIGQQWPGQGGIYAGLMRGRDGAPDYHLIVGPELTPSAWGAAVNAAAQVDFDGHADFTLPFRAEQAVLFGNVPELFEKDWYWSCEQRAANPDSAWVQFFVIGGQYDFHESIQGRARAVRRFEKI
jgi:hypothetical protein